MRSSASLFAVVFFVAGFSDRAAADNNVAVPDALKPWVPWVLHGNEEQRCPLVDVDQHRCQWPGPLELSVGARGGSFEQRWTVMKEEHVALPGGEDRWPQDVTVDGKKAVVVENGGLPTVKLAPGEHLLRGNFSWDEQPESLTIPEETALFTLTVGGRAVLFPRREGPDVYFDKEAEEDAEEREEDSLDVAIFRKIVDDAPVLVETRLVIDVAGKAREVTVPNALLPGFETAQVSGPVPVRVEGTALRAQVRPGSWTVVVVGRSVAKDVDLKGPTVDEAQREQAPLEEIWVYEARPSLRIAHVEGPPSIAADQTRLPGEWRALPAYRVLPGESWKLVEDRRGDADPPPSQLTLNRTLWFDFDGKGATVRDYLSGSFNGDRLEMGPGTDLGHVAVGGKDSFITSLAAPSSSSATAARPGVEVRQKNLSVMAESRIEGGLASFPAVSWAHDFQGASIALNLPPGWTLVNAAGVDNVSDTWLQRWTLFEIFLVVVLVTAIFRLWGPGFAAISLFGFVLTFQERDAPIASWCVVVVLAGLHRVLPESVQRHLAVRALAWLRVGVAIIVALITLDFCVTQVRVGMYPQLAQEWRAVGDGNDAGYNDRGGNGFGDFDQNAFAAKTAMAEMAPPPPPPPEPLQLAQEEMNAPAANDDGGGGGGGGKMRAAKGDLQQLLGSDGSGLNSALSGLGTRGAGSYEQKAAPMKKMKPKRQMTTVDPNAVVQTGPGLPRWGWQQVTLSFSGPVRADQRIELLLLSPTVNLLLAFLRVALLAALVVAAFGLPGGAWPRSVLQRFRGRGAVWLTALLLALSSTAAAPAAAQSVPDDETLSELRERLLAPPTCEESCVQIARMRAEATASTLRLVFEVHAEIDYAVPLPADDGQWTPRSILVDGKAANAVRDEDRVVVRVGAGVHDVVVEGPLPQRETVQLALPLAPKRGTFSSSVWTLDGIHEDGVVDENLQLSRVEKQTKQEKETEKELPPSVLPPFLLVERTVMLGLTFEAETRVVRLSPMGTPIVVDVPLLPGESVTTDGVRAEQKDGKGIAKVSLGPNDSELTWHSTLAQAETLTLAAPEKTPWLESWQVQESPLWHVTRDGIPTVHGGAVDGNSSFRPWPGESLKLTLVRPAGVAGQTVTLDEVKLNVRPGLRSTDASLHLELRASRGGQHEVKLPQGAELLSALINGASTPLRPVSAGAHEVVTVPLNPGSQRVDLELRLPTGVAFHTTSPAIDLGKEAVNVEIKVDLPDDRWVLFAWGPRTGPAVLFWSFLAIILVAAAALSRVPVSPLKLHHWVLLSLGLTQVPVPVAALVAGWLLLLGWRKRPLWTERGKVHDAVFDLLQLTLVGWTFVAVICLFVAIKEGLAGAPEMQIVGNGSSGTALRWFSDRTPATLPIASAWSVSLWAYRAAMLAWSFWLAFSLIRWLRDGFKAFGAGGYYREPWKTPPKKPAAPPKMPEAPAGAPTSAAAMSTPSTLGAPSEKHEKHEKPEKHEKKPETSSQAASQPAAEPPPEPAAQKPTEATADETPPLADPAEKKEPTA